MDARRGSIYVVEAAAGAGSGVLMIFVDDLDAELAAITARGLQPAERETYPNDVRKAVFRDPDGNEVGVGGIAPTAASSCPDPVR